MSAESATGAPLPWLERPLSELFRIAWPMVISLVSLSLMTLVDTLFVGRLGRTQLAAVGVGGTTIFTVASFGLAVLGAAKVKVGESVGRADALAVRGALGAFLRIALVLGLLSVIIACLASASLPLLTAERQLGEEARSYSIVRCLELPLVLSSAALGQWLQAQGDSKTTMRAALVANVANIPLNAVLIFGLGLGIKGAAFATVLARFVEWGWLLREQLGGRITLPSGMKIAPGLHFAASSYSAAWTAFRTGLPTGIERVLDMIAFAAVPLLLSQVGAAHVAAHQIILQLMLLSFLPLIAVSEALSVLISQAIGAKCPSVIGKLIKQALLLALAYAVVCGAFALILASRLIALFSPDKTVIAVGSAALGFAVLLQFINAAYNQVKGALRGLSVFSYVAWVTVGCAWVITPPFTYVVGVRLGMGTPGAWLVLCVEVTIGLSILSRRLIRELQARAT